MEHNKTIYLANLFAIALIDGEMTRKEWLYIENIRKTLKYTKPESKAALSLSRKPEYQIHKPGNFAYSVQNLEHMMRVAYCDMTSDPSELNILSQFCGEIGITQVQLNLMYEEVLNDLKAHPEWGEDEQTTESSKLEPPEVGAAILFAESPSASFHEIMARFKNRKLSHSVIDGKNWYMATFDNILEASNVYINFDMLKYVKFYFEGTEYTKPEFFTYIVCREKKKAGACSEYCWLSKGAYSYSDANLIPCGNCYLPLRTYWTYRGIWDISAIKNNELVWMLKKGELKDIVLENYSKSNNCPYFDKEKALAIIDMLPAKVRPDGKKWKVHFAQQQENGIYGEQSGRLARIISQQEDANGETFSCVQWADGVEPTDRFLSDFSRKLEENGLIDNSIRDLIMSPFQNPAGEIDVD